uniref:TROVE domain-containing protein n=1 Tax=Oryzias latipes TaxID=8090 RepID=A0A3B3I9U7_ORYLA
MKSCSQLVNCPAPPSCCPALQPSNLASTSSLLSTSSLYSISSSPLLSTQNKLLTQQPLSPSCPLTSSVIRDSCPSTSFGGALVSLFAQSLTLAQASLGNEVTEDEIEDEEISEEMHSSFEETSAVRKVAQQTYLCTALYSFSDLKHLSLSVQVAVYTRQELNIRITANFLLALAASLPSTKRHVRRYFCAAVQLPSDWLEVVRIYSAVSVRERLCSLPACLKKAMADKFKQFSEYQLAKYNTRKHRCKHNKKKPSHSDHPLIYFPVVPRGPFNPDYAVFSQILKTSVVL